MRICASVACSNSTRHLVKWKASVCEKHKVPHGSTACNCPRPGFRFFYFKDRNETIRAEWVRRVNRQVVHSDGRTSVPWQPGKESVLCSEHFVGGAPSMAYPYFKMGMDLGPPKPARAPPRFRSLLPKNMKKELQPPPPPRSCKLLWLQLTLHRHLLTVRHGHVAWTWTIATCFSVTVVNSAAVQGVWRKNLRSGISWSVLLSRVFEERT